MFLIDKANNKAISIERKTFHDLDFEERPHLQEWIAANTQILGEPLLIIQKEFSDWSDTNERLDLLALDERGNLVIIENKLDDSGRDVVWQALKYVSYCATLTKADICSIYQKYLGQTAVASEKIADFFDLAYEEVVLNPADGDQRIILVAANFRKEVTSTVLWLLQHGVDITCVKVTPYQVGEQVYLDSKQILPIQDAGDYQIKLSAKRQEDVAQKTETTARALQNQEFWAKALPQIREASGIFQNVSPSKDHWLNGASGHGGISFTSCIFKNNARVELYIATASKERNKEVFQALESKKERLEANFGAALVWQELPNKIASRISFASETNGINDKENWDAAIDFLSKNIAKLQKVFKQELDKILRV